MAGDVDMETAITEPVWSSEIVRTSDKWDSVNEHCKQKKHKININIQFKPYVPMTNTYTAEYDTDIKQEVSIYKPYRFHKCEKWCLFAIHTLDKCTQPIQSIFFSNSLKLN